jgi:IgA Peptidase M64
MTRAPVPTLLATAAAASFALPLAAQQPPATEPVYYDHVEPDGSLSGGRVELILPERAPVAATIAAPATTLTHALGPAPDPANRADIVYVGDGYTASELGDYAQQVDAIQPTFFAKEPFHAYQGYFTVHRVDVVSNESGVDNDPVQGVSRHGHNSPVRCVPSVEKGDTLFRHHQSSALGHKSRDGHPHLSRGHENAA